LIELRTIWSLAIPGCQQYNRGQVYLLFAWDEAGIHTDSTWPYCYNRTISVHPWCFFKGYQII